MNIDIWIVCLSCIAWTWYEICNMDRSRTLCVPIKVTKVPMMPMVPMALTVPTVHRVSRVTKVSAWDSETGKPIEVDFI